VIPDFVGYLPFLKNGATYTTQGGGNVTITVTGTVGKDAQYFVNNAKIVASNLILSNGVAHVVDQVCFALFLLCDLGMR
jgi:uncharacterized surface protein with fasciclin (FAS1) repeats